jgi:hypothetical protein
LINVNIMSAIQDYVSHSVTIHAMTIGTFFFPRAGKQQPGGSFSASQGVASDTVGWVAVEQYQRIVIQRCIVTIVGEAAVGC